VFNGDFHWFDADRPWFEEIERQIAPYLTTRGNIETELARGDDIGAGCGCAYPEYVGDAVVRRSNEILHELRFAAMALPGASTRLGVLPMHRVAAVGGLRVAIVHGDATALAGWSFTHDALDAPKTPDLLDAVRRAANVDVFASTHTCLAVLRDFVLPSGQLTIINNGAAGVPNFSGTRFGLISRIATSPSRQTPVYGVERDGVHIDAIAVEYDTDAFLEKFLARWPEGTAAHASYFGRITSGPDYSIAAARPRAA
jgi:hypothetical protein